MLRRVDAEFHIGDNEGEDLPNRNKHLGELVSADNPPPQSGSVASKKAYDEMCEELRRRDRGCPGATLAFVQRNENFLETPAITLRPMTIDEVLPEHRFGLENAVPWGDDFHNLSDVVEED